MYGRNFNDFVFFFFGYRTIQLVGWLVERTLPSTIYVVDCLPVKNLVVWHRALVGFYRIRSLGKIRKKFFRTIPKCHRLECLEVAQNKKKRIVINLLIGNLKAV